MADIAQEKYVRLTTYRQDGTPKYLPVWIADMGDGTVGFTTASSSYKVKRIRINPKVALQPSDSRGKVRAGTAEVTGTAELVSDGGFESVRAIVRNKYGFQYSLAMLAGSTARLFGRGTGTDTGVVVTLDG